MKHKKSIGLHHCQKICYLKYCWKGNAWIAIWHCTFQLSFCLVFFYFHFQLLRVPFAKLFYTLFRLFCKTYFWNMEEKCQLHCWSMHPLWSLRQDIQPFCPAYISTYAVCLSNLLQLFLCYIPPWDYIAIAILLNSFDRMTWP